VDLNQVTVPCTDYAGTVRFYQLLGLQLIVDSPPRYARFETEKGTTFSIHAGGMAPSGADMTVYFEVADVDATVARLREKGVTFTGDPVDQEWLWREAYTSDPSGNTICIYHAGENRRFPPWRVS
jgi:hydroxymethylpyrimidine/phosphomethylpyrimidine kinase